VIAIDGPVGAGKSTVARALAQRLGYRYVDTGAMYRSVAWQATHRGIDLDDRAAVAEVARAIEIEFVPGAGGQRVVAQGTDVTEAIRSPRMSEGASIVSAYPEVREALVALQRRMGEGGGVIMEGRDIGTVVFPDAEVKIYLDASLDERARRRHKELRAKGEAITFEGVREALRERDHRDSTRAHSPLRAAPDAVVIDSTTLTVAQIVDEIVQRLPTR
jgi:cytidylate kinase